MKKGRKVLSLVLALMLLLTLMPVTALADGQPGMVQGTSALSVGANTANAATVHYGGQTWRVIGYDGAGAAAASGNMTLLAAENIGHAKYDPESPYSNVYSGSNLQIEVNDIAIGFSGQERASMVARTLEGNSANYGVTEGEIVYHPDHISGDSVKNALLWPLSVQEATAVDEELRVVDPEHPAWASSFWWLRSPGEDGDDAAYVNGDGIVYDTGFDVTHDEIGVRPAFYLDLNSVLFTSAAAGGKSSGAVGAGALTEVSAVSSNEWKLTITDAAHAGFTAAPCAVIYDESTGIVTVPYSGAVTGTGEYISAVIMNSSGAITYYGRVAEATAEEGTVTIDVNGKLSDGDKLYVFNEQYHNDTATDYASQLMEITLPPVGHTEAEDPAVPATCTETGLTAGVHCSVCGEVFTAQETVDALGHDWGDWTVTKEAQPGAAGERQRTCSRCDMVETEEIPALPVYTVTQGAGGSWTQGSGTDYVITVTSNEDNANCFSHYTGTLIDGQRAAVSARSGSTIVTIPVDVLERLSVGAHTVTVKFDNGEVSTQLTIKAAEQETTAPAEETTAPAAETTAAETTAADPGRTPTGDSTRPGFWIGLACAAGIACAAAAVAAKKRKA